MAQSSSLALKAWGALLMHNTQLRFFSLQVAQGGFSELSDLLKECYPQSHSHSSRLLWEWRAESEPVPYSCSRELFVTLAMPYICRELLFTSTVLSDLITERTRISQHFAVFGPQWWQNQGPLLLPAFCPCLVPSGGTHFS